MSPSCLIRRGRLPLEAGGLEWAEVEVGEHSSFSGAAETREPKT